MTAKLDGKSLTIESLVKIARDGEPVEVTEDAWERIRRCRAMLNDKVEKREVMYGVTTGIGELSEVVLTPEQTQEFQRYLVYSHSAGCGEPCDVDDIRAAMTTRINCHCIGYSGLRPVVVETLLGMLNKGVTPVVFRNGSVGASGDLSPMSQVALVLIGEGEAFYGGKRMDGKKAMDAAGIPTIVFEARDGLATINGSNVVAGMGSLEIYDAYRWAKTQEAVAAITFEVLNVNTLCLDERLHKARGYPGAVTCAANLRRLVDGSEMLVPGKMGKKKIQNAYSLRSTPQVVGSSKDAFDWARQMFETEINGAGMFSGLMLTQYTAGMLVNENRVLCHPAAVGSIPAAADQEDFVSMAMNTAIKTKQILRNGWYIIAIELIAACQAMDHRRPLKGGAAAEAVYKLVRKHVAFMEEDRPTQYDINRVAELVKSGEVLEVAEKAAGELG